MRGYLKGFAVVHWKDDFGLEWGGKWRVADSKDKKVRVKLRCILYLQPVGSDNGIDMGNEREESEDFFFRHKLNEWTTATHSVFPIQFHYAH